VAAVISVSLDVVQRPDEGVYLLYAAMSAACVVRRVIGYITEWLAECEHSLHRLQTNHLKVDGDGNPLEVAAILVWGGSRWCVQKSLAI
jgi:hypothetical protein